MSDACQNELFDTFMSDTGIKSKAKTVTSSDGLPTVKATNCVAQKPGQNASLKHVAHKLTSIECFCLHCIGVMHL